ncbi:CidA/LrgA family protein [Cohnella sp. WQ 127256]|uniref:CidA/LrgA family protein n=1 Tax=Cohnella sp. WQ 127256 TaxID=2938790 RepID=UPI0021191F94|nr:CidA/LrgA family holin-like protein [Cohnella sp. WQ 127256]
MRTLLKTIAQVSFFILLAKAADISVQSLQLPIPGSLIGIAILFVLLQLKVIRFDWIDLGSKWLLANMLLFFVPATVHIIEYKNLVMSSGLRIVLTIICSIVIVMVCAGLVSQKLATRKVKGAK